MMTAEKQIIIATISTMKTRSLKMQKAKIEIQNGLVCQHTITSEIGASGAARFSNTKLIWPVNMRQNNGYFLAEGNCFIGFALIHAHQIMATVIARKFLSKLKSAAWKPSFAIIL